jgi:hypothetical protein
MTAATVYIAGPITGYPDHNRHAFEYAAKRLGKLGYDVWDATEKTPVQDGWAWADYVRAGLQGVLAADVLCLLDGWEASRGARLEVDVAHALGVTTLPALTLYLGPIIQAERAATLGDTPTPELCSVCGEPEEPHGGPVVSPRVVRMHAAAGLDTFERVETPTLDGEGGAVPGAPRFTP